DGCGIVDLLRAHTDFRARARLVSHVDPRSGIVAREDYGKAGAHSALHKRIDLPLQSGADCRREGFSVEDLRGHWGAAQSSIGPLFWLSLPRPPAANRISSTWLPFHNFPLQTTPTRSKRKSGSTRSKRCSSAKAPSARITCSS